MINLKSVNKALSEDGAYVHRALDIELGISLEGVTAELDAISASYSDVAVTQKLYRPRENHPDRTGDAVMSTIGEPKHAPFLKMQGKNKNLMRLQMQYNDILSYFFGEDMSDTKSLMNWQRYRQGGDNALPFHVDSEFFKGQWDKDYIDLEDGLIPRFVMVMITENENAGAGLQIKGKDGEVSNLELNPGDMVIFDNTKMLHGVPVSTPNKRSMVGFRNFEAYPLYFNKVEFDGSQPYENGHIKGFAETVDPDKARTMLFEEEFTYA